MASRTEVRFTRNSAASSRSGGSLRAGGEAAVEDGVAQLLGHRLVQAAAGGRAEGHDARARARSSTLSNGPTNCQPGPAAWPAPAPDQARSPACRSSAVALSSSSAVDQQLGAATRGPAGRARSAPRTRRRRRPGSSARRRVGGVGVGEEMRSTPHPTARRPRPSTIDAGPGARVRRSRRESTGRRTRRSPLVGPLVVLGRRRGRSAARPPGARHARHGALAGGRAAMRSRGSAGPGRSSSSAW